MYSKSKNIFLTTKNPDTSTLIGKANKFAYMGQIFRCVLPRHAYLSTVKVVYDGLDFIHIEKIECDYLGDFRKLSRKK